MRRFQPSAGQPMWRSSSERDQHRAVAKCESKRSPFAQTSDRLDQCSEDARKGRPAAAPPRRPLATASLRLRARGGDRGRHCRHHGLATRNSLALSARRAAERQVQAAHRESLESPEAGAGVSPPIARRTSTRVDRLTADAARSRQHGATRARAALPALAASLRSSGPIELAARSPRLQDEGRRD